MNPGTCKECGTAIPADSPGGFCAQCLLRLGLEEAGEPPPAEARGQPPEGPEPSNGEPDQPSSDEDHQSRLQPGAPLTEKAGDRIGRYRLLQEIGHGGCGVVYMAEQEEPVRRKVALKVIKLGMDTRQVVARFEAERQALALMDHPNIARILDAGVTETPVSSPDAARRQAETSSHVTRLPSLVTSAGRPYFVMELVGGIRITDYCDRHHLATRQRLELFVQVCQAIQHAHQKGVIHRDIKPSNVLVATQDGVPVPKVIDFGIAKATQGRLTDQTVFTAFEQFIGTPAYMSPEQAQLGSLDVDTRSDIYSLGVLLYELLTGRTPFDTKDLVAAGLDEMRRTIRQKEPLRPSTRLSTLARDELEVAAEQRQSDAPRLIHLLRGDLDWIVMKCLEKDRARRYETANGLARDIERHLNQEPVVARPPSTIYKVHKFIRRNRVTATAATATATALVLGMAVSTWEAVRAWRAEREQSRLRQEAQAARQDATEKLWRSYLAEARALRISGQAGRHFESLSLLRKAAAIRSSLPATDLAHDPLQLRNEAIAARVLPDLQRVGGKDFSKRRESTSLEPSFERYAVCEKTGVVSVRRVADDSEVARLPGMQVSATSVWEFSPDGRFLPVGYADGHCRVWDWAKGAVAVEVPVFLGSGFAPDSRAIGVSDATNIVLHDLTSGKRLNTISLNGLASARAPGWFRFDPAGRRLALYATEQRTNVSILDTRTGQTLKTLQQAAPVFQLAWHPAGRLLATGCDDGTIQIWDTTSGERLRFWHTDSCVSLGFNHRGNLLASSGWDNYTRLWDFGTGRELTRIRRSGCIAGFALDDLSLATAGWESTSLDFFEVATGQGLRTLYEAPQILSSLRGGLPIMDTAGTLLAFRNLEGIGLWEVQSAQQISAPWLDKELNLIGFDAAGQNLILTGSEGLFRCPITRSGGGESRTFGKAVLVSAECADPMGGRMGRISANGKVCAVVGNNRCQFFRTDTFQKLAETGIQPGMRFSDINSDGSLFASGAWLRGGASIWNAQTGALVKKLPSDYEQENTFCTVAFSPDGRYLVTATPYEYCFWEVGSWSLVRRIPQEPGNDFSPMMAFSRDGRILAGTHLRTKVRLHDAATGQVLADLEAPNSKFISGLLFSQDGTQLFACESLDALRLWDLRQIRRQLTELDLDWDQPPYPPAQPGAAARAEAVAVGAPPPLASPRR